MERTASLNLLNTHRSELAYHLWSAGQEWLASDLMNWDNGAPPCPIHWNRDHLHTALLAISSARWRGDTVSPELSRAVTLAFQQLVRNQPKGKEL